MSEDPKAPGSYHHGTITIVPDRVARLLVKHTRLEDLRGKLYGSPDTEAYNVLCDLLRAGSTLPTADHGTNPTPISATAGALKEWRTVQEIATALNLKPRTIRQAIADKALPATWHGGQHWIHVKDFETYKASRAR